MAKSLPEDVKEILEDNIIINNEDNTIEITKDNLDRNLYVKVDKLFKSLGGKWNRKANAHVFKATDKDLETVIAEVLNGGKLPEKNPFNFFPTPKLLTVEMIDWSGIDKDEFYDILEPSAGEGHISKVLRSELLCSDLEVCELEATRAKHLREEGFTVIEGDFLEFDKPKVYDYIFMNPPFNVTGDNKAYMTHIYKAYELLKEDGTLIAIAPTGFINNSIKRDKEFLSFVNENGEYKMNPENSFKESKTMISTAMIKLIK